MVQPQPIRSDEEIERDIVDALTFDVRVDEKDLTVEVKRGVVHLRGAVASLFQKSTAQQICERIKGAQKVVNELSVMPCAERSDEVLLEEIEGAFRRDAFIDERGITVAVHKGVVTLQGTVPSYTERSAAEDSARLAIGVKEVVNGLVVTPGRPV